MTFLLLSVIVILGTTFTTKFSQVAGACANPTEANISRFQYNIRGSTANGTAYTPSCNAKISAPSTYLLRKSLNGIDVYGIANSFARCFTRFSAESTTISGERPSAIALISSSSKLSSGTS